ncbi:MAG: hypothetical protein A2X86_00090 [Bdellovibrionales bacterium GWA2_49_15]|nr:MAG: hypothetical protein A2X86_00090 [Bdellovibrionales bacterium GWA2_49_15]HAZ14441.1 hypothetical protein [Bdellovibrionales bacterium]
MTKNRGIAYYLTQKWWVTLPACLFIIHLAWVVFVLPNEVIKDEIFFLAVAQHFVALNFNNWSTLAINYPLPQPPLLFIMGSWMFHFSNPLIMLRMANCLVMFLTLTIVFKALADHADGKKALVIAAVVSLLCNPYMQLISVLFYTDTFYLLMVAIFLAGFLNSQLLWKSWGGMMAPLVRQFGITYNLGRVAELVLQNKPRQNWKEALVLLGGLVPLGLIFLFWCGVSPSPEIQAKMAMIRQTHGYFYWQNVIYYIAATAFWLLPVVVVVFMKKKFSPRDGAIFVAGAILAFIFYPTGNLYHESIGTLGIFHRLYNHFPWHLNKLFYAFFVGLGGIFFADFYLTPSIHRQFKIWGLFFFGLQLINPLCWDKYILELLILVIMGLVSTTRESA